MLFNATDAAMLGNECLPKAAGSSECVGAVTVGSYTCLRDVDDTVPIVEFTTPAATRYGTQQRVNCTVPAPSVAAATASAPWAAEVGRWGLAGR